MCFFFILGGNVERVMLDNILRGKYKQLFSSCLQDNIKLIFHMV